MTGGTLSGGVVIALAATLWLAYLVPTWLRRRDYMNAERNAVRLQQTLRILAETAEAPEEVRVEPTARDVARQQRLLKKVQAKAAASARAHAASEARAIARAEAAHDDQLPPLGATDVAEAEVAVQRADVRSAPSRAERERTFMRAVRRTRLATTGAVAASVIGIVFGVHSLLISGSWWLLAASAVLFVCAVAVLRRLAQQIAAHRAARHGRMPVVRQNPDLYDHAEHADPAPVAEPAADEADGWEPQPLPKPMYQSPGSRAAAAMASLDAAVALRRAAARAELEERAARLAAAQVPTLPVREQPQEPEREVAEQPAQAPRPASRYSSMGMLGDVESEHIDLDEALRRRRAAG
ncbi:hypothetical protein [Humibacter ginsenosidimutans]|uniref:Large exoprotein n=1 Tax=Humibacter ginsenosidimutans TaxID=2599293 RepID=A0A5B8M5B7_9MICO|nr:hypothetical protein [Humibacter ginsenosidimutans]QDZ14700.1 hypothetical protein FPZ11_07970 [Humibacter ginsenosidimutans]